ncbi:hypothetical protein KZ483_06600 [Paenibacillus sp. sptzw28]|uniref:hypothetical protein n=1 Tax=Paenibacillus sp. sptzw28 TaxID=715179 RepID=UPI001C6EB5F1|nr:hypothetical protein [Paenibacillus sp. sptzw28]QYR22625.1 hypothetical protein KZ483_06600 [Paenibacillus sp. sptzw28]
MSIIKGTLLVLAMCITLIGCGGGETIDKQGSTSDVTGDKLYIPEGYKNELGKRGLTEVIAKPYFQSPFITIAKDKKDNQVAVIFRDDGKTDQVELPLKYEQIVSLLKEKYPNKELLQENIHIFDINGQLYWNYAPEEHMYLNLMGEEVADPFKL